MVAVTFVAGFGQADLVTSTWPLSCSPVNR